MSYQDHKKNVISNAVSFSENLYELSKGDKNNLGLIFVAFGKNLNKIKNRRSFTFKLSLWKGKNSIPVKIKVSQDFTENKNFIWLLELE